MPEYQIRVEEPGDAAGIRKVETLAFGTPDEAELVDRLRGRSDAMLSLVAVSAGSSDENGEPGDAQILGHVLFTPVTIDCEATTGDEEGASMALGPVVVLPELQGRGIGAALIRAGLEQLRAGPTRRVFVLGHPEYYPRFGFEPAWNWGLYFDKPGPAPHFMALSLDEGALAGLSGKTVYRPEFYDL